MYVAVLACAVAGVADAREDAGPPAGPTATVTQPQRERKAPAPVNAPPRTLSANDLCGLIAGAAQQHGLPVAFFSRLIWAESRFRSDAVSPKGAKGIAQFMPGTAAERGLLDPFDPEAAIAASAALLADHKARFGNLGLAAAAYNAGAQRVANWLANGGALPWETQDYVLAITGIAADVWAVAKAPPGLGEASGTACPALAPPSTVRAPAAVRVPAAVRGRAARTPAPPAAPRSPWGVQVAGDFSRARAVSLYGGLQKRFPRLLAQRAPMLVSARMAGRGTRPFYRVRIPMPTRGDADRFCADLQAAGGSCVVLKT